MLSLPGDTPFADYLQSRWLLGPITFVIWVLLFLLVKRYALRWLQRVATRTEWAWDDVMVKALSGPLLMLIVASGLLVFERILPLSPEWDRAFDIVMAAAMVLSLILFVDVAVRGVLDRVAEKNPVLQGAHGLVQGLLRGIIIALGLLIFLDSIGISITPILASLGIGSLAVALALKDSLANLFAGIQLIMDKTVEPGHVIRLESGVEGSVSKMSWRTTQLLTRENATVVIPNAKLTEGLITNYNLPEPEMDVRVELGIHYDSDLEKVERVVVDVAREIQTSHPDAAQGYEPRMRFSSFGDSGIQLVVIGRAKNHEGGQRMRHQLIKTLRSRLEREAIHIPFPTRTLDIPEPPRDALRQKLFPAGEGPAAEKRPAPSTHDGNEPTRFS